MKLVFLPFVRSELLWIRTYYFHTFPDCALEPKKFRIEETSDDEGNSVQEWRASRTIPGRFCRFYTEDEGFGAAGESSCRVLISRVACTTRLFRGHVSLTSPATYDDSLSLYYLRSRERRMPSTASRLQLELNAITGRLEDLLKELPIERFENTAPGIVFICPEYHWGQASAEQVKAQLAIKRDYERWFEVFSSVFRIAPDNLSRRIKEADQEFRQWVELNSNWILSSDRVVNEKHLREVAERFEEILAIVKSDGTVETILIPDTNAVINAPDPTAYKAIADADDDRFVFLLLPTVLAELDTLKNSHRNEGFREKVKKAITRIKGWRRQGSLLDGVTVNKNITVKAGAIEPDMEHTLTWLDEHNRDDQIIATVLEAQSAHPAARAILVSGDINLLNKADMVWIETAESPKQS